MGGEPNPYGDLFPPGEAPENEAWPDPPVERGGNMSLQSLGLGTPGYSPSTPSTVKVSDASLNASLMREVNRSVILAASASAQVNRIVADSDDPRDIMNLSSPAAFAPWEPPSASVGTSGEAYTPPEAPRVNLTELARREQSRIEEQLDAVLNRSNDPLSAMYISPLSPRNVAVRRPIGLLSDPLDLSMSAHRERLRFDEQDFADMPELVIDAPMSMTSSGGNTSHDYDHVD